ncbi:MFS transporter [Microbispora sp. SCL1-1]|uniref:MFS transporter n=1 Tax=unclassified Microbispora TaxID=2614687 RepID=UPI00115B4C57|nr:MULTISPECIES: MFS transporter [unclassified Microbispora]NJP27938.1 MFS transporter [Microbispora sp. CL1-1]TQS10467.1 MFS transporter [Microbispora sp. SCL1-1]
MPVEDTASARGTAPAPRDRQARLATFAVFFVQGLTFATLLTQVAALQKKHGLTDGELTILLLVVPVIAGAGSALAGAAASRWGSRLILRVVQPVACAAVVLAGLAPNVPMLVAANILFGLGLGGVDAGMNMQGVAVEREYGRAVLTGFHALWSVAAVIGSVWASAAATLALGLPVTFAIALVPAAAVSVLASLWLYRPEEEHRAAPAPAKTTDQTANAAKPAGVAWRPIIPLCLAMAFLYVGDSSVSNFGTVFMDKVVHASATVIPLALGAYQLTTFLVRVGGDFAVRRWGPAAIVRAGGTVATLGFVAIVAAPTVPLAIAGFALTGIGLSVVAPQSFSAAGRLDPAGTGVAIARVNMFNYVGFIVGAALVGGLADASGYRVAFGAPLVLAAAIILLARGFQPRKAEPAATTTVVTP